MISPSHHGTSAYPSGKWLHEGIKPAMFLHGGGKIMGIEMTKGRYDDGWLADGMYLPFLLKFR